MYHVSQAHSLSQSLGHKHTASVNLLDNLHDESPGYYDLSICIVDFPVANHKCHLELTSRARRQNPRFQHTTTFVHSNTLNLGLKCSCFPVSTRVHNSTSTFFSQPLGKAAHTRGIPPRTLVYYNYVSYCVQDCHILRWPVVADVQSFDSL